VVVHNPPMGTHQITATILDQDNNSHTSENLNFRIISDLSQLAITTLGLNEGIVNKNYSQIIQAEGGSHNYTISVSGLPNGLTFDPSNNTIIGTPTQAGTYPTTITVNDNDGTNTIEKEFSLNVREGTYAGNGGNNNQSNSAELSRNPLSVSVTEGGNVSDKTILVTDNLGNSLAFQIVGVNGDWISSPKAGDTGNRTLNVSFDTTALSTGNHNGSVTLKPDGFNKLTLNILLTVLGSGEGGGGSGGSGGGNLPECQCGIDLFPGYDNYCSLCGPCNQNEGPCYYDSQCKGDLVCDQVHGYNFCVTPKVAASYPGWRCPVDVGDPMYCVLCRAIPGVNTGALCMEGEGWCNYSAHCMSGGLDCSRESGPNYHTCTRVKGPGITCRE